MLDRPFVTVVIPVWRDAAALDDTLGVLEHTPDAEVIVAHVLGESGDYAAIRGRHPSVRWVEAPRGRGVQMNTGAAAARGTWLLFLHADSRLPADWVDAIRDAGRKRNVVAGAYRLRLDTAGWRARMIEAGVRARVAVFGMPYGDQGLFVRREAFERAGRYRDLPLMEDVDLVRRLRRIGRLHRDRRAVTTSARRWERDGWLRRSAGNLVLATAYAAGASARTLARRYHTRPRHAVVMMARAPWLPGKTRLAASLTPEAHLELRRALFFDTLDTARSVRGAQCIVACEPPDACDTLRSMLPAGVAVIAQRGGDLGSRIAAVFDDVFRLGHEKVAVIGSDAPDLPVERLTQALRAVGRRRRAVVLGPATDGGYYLVGLRQPSHALFEGIEWSSARVLEQTLARARQAGMSAILLEPWQDVDDAADLRDLAMRARGLSGIRCRQWLRRNDGTPAA